MKKVLITPRSFAKNNRDQIFELLSEHGIAPVLNPYGRILTEDDMIRQIHDADGLIVGVDPVTRDVLEAAPKLRAIAKYGVGVDNIDMECALSRGVSVSRTIGANADAVADFTMTLLLAVARRLTEIDSGCHHGDWAKKEALDVYGKRIGVLGLGAIGKGVAKRAQGFDMSVFAYDIVKDEQFIKRNNIIFTDVETIVRECDFITLHLPLTETTRHLLNKNSLKAAKPNLVVVNTARGALLDEASMFDLLATRRIYGLGVDVFEHEPPCDSRLLTLPNVIAGSHTAASSQGATAAMSEMASRNIIRALSLSN
ncbi:D-isomer specific 2-hydroxyacid dehydrogenase NAD-binding protein [Coriobacterium glomerans PW2]|uniref:D-isomer specific 2-hydroxyacid dehydrogenase NAD-binding protein n=1 Tax=Coriobacterium glomerans (strain ATCC 49209 / DSM 20642 / JCM 10262 / PW2) TaxID=700015 RepID=F2N7I8_CORGP|nr:phosphoglycerate dehydrogenase [Coriobacterium glomerans]AEB06804.1 D-isomer specific 2-hydroxyacid dehydrogenase NAD-binding protein [Coriobacterium glomerans PW2]